ncbi:unnamed protein product [Bursaphelenchus okinawaensis]|uniref:CCR4-NOT transcription complex subunit 1 domain-containing protein n=1 Tax=Bursaphelenchus okinawaensis TaxID=465554 RepID=A0A811KG08_9BILA|nr:unnamed protein product [Bursaphelenchus okinawaensis]CAG9102733.1 unnamed protein product [Bursaphelenchus okinawaensis]
MIRQATIAATTATGFVCVDRPVDFSLTVTSIFIQKYGELQETMKSEATELLLTTIREATPAFCRTQLEKAIQNSLVILLSINNLLTSGVNDIVQMASNATVDIATEYITKIACEEGRRALMLHLERRLDYRSGQPHVIKKLPLYLQQRYSVDDDTEGSLGSSGCLTPLSTDSGNMSI